MVMYICEVSKIRTRPCWTHNYCLFCLLCNNGVFMGCYSGRMVMEMTLEEAIEHTKDIVKNTNVCTSCRMEHKQLEGWLEELLIYRKKIEQLEERTQLAYKRYIDTPCNSPCYVRYQTQYYERKQILDFMREGFE